ncbi:MAG: DNA-formamidopyrimidine glycosylase [Negativicutes bacterium]|nr:DNA-formamidopyrimidine glycosylase [Negativicutes bacterium]
MPEMPEVETIRRTLENKVTGKHIKEVEMLLPRLIKWPTAHEFQAVVTHGAITRLERRGKYLLFHLDNDCVMVVHLRMTGRLRYLTPGTTPDRFTRIVFHFTGGDALEYADSRTLGTLYALQPAELWRIAGLASMGPEPLSPEFTLDYFRETMAGRKGKIKALLLNQKLIGGLGNIYVDECLALAGINPERVGASLSEAEVVKLHNAINQVIHQGIEHGGTTFRDYRDGDGKSGSNQHHLNVYGRKNQACNTCGTPIAKTEVAGRGTHFCPTCQR